MASRLESAARPFRPEAVVPGLIVVLVGIAATSVVAAGAPMLLVVAGALAVAVVVTVAMRPAVGAYLIVGVTPFLAGIDRGALIPALRPSEAVAGLVLGGLATRAVMKGITRGWRRPTITRLDVAVVLLAVLSSVLPLLWLAARGLPIQSDDALYALTLWKLVAIYVIARSAVSTERQIATCLWISLVVATIVATVGILQALQVGPVTSFLASHFAPYGNVRSVQNGRGGSTLSLPIAAADLFTFNLAIAVGFMARTAARRIVLVPLVCILLLGVLAAGEFSGAIGAIVGIVAATIIVRRTRILWFVVPATAVGGFALRSIIETRLSGFRSASGVPASWAGRLNNLTMYFWPQLSAGNNFLLGVRPAARVPVASQATGYVWIESGYTWLLWSGGLPLLFAFLWFVVVGVRRALALARQRRGPVSVIGVAAAVALIVVATLMPLDPHLTYRGSAELLFVLLGLACAPATRVDSSADVP